MILACVNRCSKGRPFCRFRNSTEARLWAKTGCNTKSQETKTPKTKKNYNMRRRVRVKSFDCRHHFVLHTVPDQHSSISTCYTCNSITRIHSNTEQMWWIRQSDRLRLFRRNKLTLEKLGSPSVPLLQTAVGSDRNELDTVCRRHAQAETCAKTVSQTRTHHEGDSITVNCTKNA